MKTRRYFFTRGVLFLLLMAWQGSTQQWTRFRGPNGTGISNAAGIPSSWTEADYLWKIRLPGTGHSSPVLWGDKCFITSADEKDEVVVLQCLDVAGGQEIWRVSLPFKPYPQHRFNRFASSTPAVDDSHVFVWQPGPESSVFYAFDLAGKALWEKELGPLESQHGGGASPVVFNNQVVLANDHKGQSFLISMDVDTGTVHWKTPRRSAMTAYGAPCVYEAPGGKSLMVFNSEAHGITAVDPASGKVVWEKSSLFDKRSVSSSLVASGLLIGSCGSGGGGNYVVAVRPPVNPDDEPELVWTIRRSAPYVPTSLAVGDDLFLWNDGGVVSCVDAPTGNVFWSERVGGNYFGSPVWIDGKLYAISSTGEVVVIRAGREFQVLGRTELGEESHSTPAVSGNRLFLRTLSQLFCLGN